MAAGASVLVPQTFCVESPPRLHLTRLDSTRRRLRACEAMLRLRQQMEHCRQHRTNICRACSCVACRPDCIEEERSAAAAPRGLCSVVRERTTWQVRDYCTLDRSRVPHSTDARARASTRAFCLQHLLVVYFAFDTMRRFTCAAWKTLLWCAHEHFRSNREKGERVFVVGVLLVNHASSSLSAPLLSARLVSSDAHSRVSFFLSFSHSDARVWSRRHAMGRGRGEAGRCSRRSTKANAERSGAAPLLCFDFPNESTLQENTRGAERFDSASRVEHRVRREVFRAVGRVARENRRTFAVHTVLNRTMRSHLFIVSIVYCTVFTNIVEG